MITVVTICRYVYVLAVAHYHIGVGADGSRSHSFKIDLCVLHWVQIETASWHCGAVLRQISTKTLIGHTNYWLHRNEWAHRSTFLVACLRCWYQFYLKLFSNSVCSVHLSVMSKFHDETDGWMNYFASVSSLLLTSNHFKPKPKPHQSIELYIKVSLLWLSMHQSFKLPQNTRYSRNEQNNNLYLLSSCFKLAWDLDDAFFEMRHP